MSFKNKIMNYFTMDDEYEYEYIEEESLPNEAENSRKTQNVVNLRSIEQPVQKVVLCEPGGYNEVQEIANHLVNKCAVVMNLQRADHKQAKRIVDFLSGAVYAVNGDIKKLGAATFLCTPENMDVTGSISDVFQEDEY